ncbi:Extracellular serine protease precursor [Legionella birminghamensis]|uniref:Extracellular serine protease n=1 Tax=Legionella birminghamensis TaxID=28083 RepID=A0A378ID14_9GAMM|nr:autotransporter domain-containing protein [Legionella birminghamensis]KTC74506.1 Extracellular serine protease precursor [Legionella birminghamensis]STX32635.1 Extracellular serine protease precursor [Legionella birminghamensis]
MSYSPPKRKFCYLFSCKQVIPLLTALCISNASWAVDWTGSVSNDWFDPLNWIPGVPAAGDSAIIDTIIPNPTEVNSSSTAFLTSLLIGDLNEGTFNIVNGGIVSNFLGSIGTNAGSTGTVTVSGAGSQWNNAAVLEIGGFGTGTLTIQDGAAVTAGNATIGLLAGSLGILSMDKGSLTINGQWLIGYDGTADVTMSNGSQVNTNSTVVANTANSVGIIDVQGQGTQWNNSGNLVIGNQGFGDLCICDGGVVNNWAAVLGAQLGSTGVVGVEGQGSQWNNKGSLIIGLLSDGSLSIVDGGLVTSQSAVIASGANSVSTADIFGQNSHWFNRGNLIVGDSGNGSLFITDGGTVSNQQAVIAANAGSTGAALVQGEGSRWNNLSLVIGQHSAGALSIQSGALVNVMQQTILGGGPALLEIVANGVLQTNQLIGNSVFIGTHLDGGILRANGNNNAFISGFLPGQLFLSCQGLAIDSNGFNIATDNVFDGCGGLTKTGPGQLTLGGQQAYTGSTTVNQGVLRIDGSLPGEVEVLAGARLQGTGSMGTAVVAGNIAPGNSIGTLSVLGNYLQLPGSVYELEINTSGQSDLINVGGTATIAGEVVLLRAPGIYTPGTRYTILTAQGGVIGTYSNLNESLPFLNIFLAYDPQHVYLDIERNGLRFSTAALTVNQFNTAEGIESLGAGNAVYDAISNLGSLYLAPQALDSLSGEIHVSTLGAFMEESRYLRYAAMNRLQQASSAREGLQVDAKQRHQSLSGVTWWGQGFGAWGELEGNGNAAQTDRSTRGFFLGADTASGLPMRMGVIGGISHSDIKVYARNSWVSSDNYHLGLYAGSRLASLSLRGGAAYSWHDIHSHRNIVFPGFSNAVKANSNGDTAQLFAELGYPLILNRVELEPFAGGSYVNVESRRFFETGSAAALNGRGQENLFYSTLGLRETSNVMMNNKLIIAQRLMLGWQHANHHLDPQTLMAFNSGSSGFTIYGSPLARDSILLDAGLLLQRPETDNLQLKLSYIAQWASNVQDNGIMGTLIYRMS